MTHPLKTVATICALILATGLCAAQQPPGGPTSTDAMSEFGTTASNVFFYYDDLAAATDFYTQVMGFRIAADYGYAKIMQVANQSFITLVDARKGMHSADEPKTTAIALVTDQLDEWWDYIQTQDIQMRSTSYTPRDGSAHDGFVAIDPEGYYLEFERFNPHEENDRFLPMLDAAETLYPEAGTSSVPPGLGFKATIVWFYYQDMERIQHFYEDTLGFDLVVDQGWAKIYAIGPTGYFGPVDEQRGMHSYTEQKGVTLSLITGDIDGWYEYLSKHPGIEMRSDDVNETDRYRAFVAYDPEGYYLEWDVFKQTAENAALTVAIGE
jgi:catechol 2,3-dioxygenase-like lactoylglutathione lyase family enzyme